MHLQITQPHKRVLSLAQSARTTDARPISSKNVLMSKSIGFVWAWTVVQHDDCPIANSTLKPTDFKTESATLTLSGFGSAVVPAYAARRLTLPVVSFLHFAPCVRAPRRLRNNPSAWLVGTTCSAHAESRFYSSCSKMARGREKSCHFTKLATHQSSNIFDKSERKYQTRYQQEPNNR